MISHIQLTERQRIKRSDISITLSSKSDQLGFRCDLARIAEYSLPPEALVFVEAYRQTAWMRFDFGKVGAIIRNEFHALSDFDTADKIHFRVKVSSPDSHKVILAEADGIPITEQEDGDAPQISLLPVKGQSLNSEVFKVDFTSKGPLLLVNTSAGDARLVARSPAFVSLAFPLIVRQVLTMILMIEKQSEDDDPLDWKCLWIRFAKRIPGLGEFPDIEDQDSCLEWIDRAAEAFSQKFRLLERFDEFWKGDDGK